jgi:hypothetical protein
MWKFKDPKQLRGTDPVSPPRLIREEKGQAICVDASAKKQYVIKLDATGKE